MTGFTRPKRFCVPENRNYTAVKTKELDALESSCEKLYAERDALRALLSDIRAHGRITGNVAQRLIVALAKEEGNGVR